MTMFTFMRLTPADNVLWLARLALQKATERANLSDWRHKTIHKHSGKHIPS